MHTFKYRWWRLELMPDIIARSKIHIQKFRSKVCSTSCNLVWFELKPQRASKPAKRILALEKHQWIKKAIIIELRNVNGHIKQTILSNSTIGLTSSHAD